MEKKIENRLIMLKTTLSLMEQNESIWQATAPLMTAVTQTKVLLQEIELLKQTVSQNSSGLAVVKENRKESIITSHFELMSVLSAYASQVGDPILEQKVKFPLSYLQNMRDGELATFCRAMLLLASEKVSELAPYDITAQKITDMGEEVGQYETALPGTRVNVAERKATNAKIKELAKDAMKITEEQTDRLMVKFKTTHPEFYQAYLNARKIVDYGTRYEKEENGEIPADPVPGN